VSCGSRRRRIAASEQAILADTFPAEKFWHGLRDLRDGRGLGAIIGPTLGCYIVDQLQLALDFLHHVPVEYLVALILPDG